MSDLIAVSFAGRNQAERVRLELLRMEREQLVDVEGVVVAYREGDGQVRMSHLYGLSAKGALCGGFWGLLFGMLLMSPLFGVVTGAAWGAVARAMNDVGIDETFMKERTQDLDPGASALFLQISDANAELLLDELSSHEGKLLRTSLSLEDEHALREALERVSVARAA